MSSFNLKVMTTAVIAICYIIITMSYCFLKGTTQFLERWGQTNELTIYLKNPPTPSQSNEIEKTLAEYKDMTHYEYINNEKLFDNLKKELPALSQEIEKNSALTSLLPPHYIVTADASLFNTAPTSLFTNLINNLKTLPIVSDMSYGEPWLKKYSQFLLSVKGFTLFIYFSLALALVLVVGNAIRNSIASKRDEIEILELIGATPAMIRKPFLKEGAGISLVAMLFALAFSSGLLYFFSHMISDSYNIFGLEIIIRPFHLSELVLFILLAIALGLMGSYWVIKSYTEGTSLLRRS